MIDNPLKSYRIAAVSIEPGEDETTSIIVYASPFPWRDGAPIASFEFTSDINGRQSSRLRAFLDAVDTSHSVATPDDLEGRLFCVRGRGASASDFLKLDFAFEPFIASAA